ncbi:MAG TPA: tetratricopeptide repeat protein [Chryseosolibacter sp.]|nr:tetratricopeptide repeat protein [Chryseosolibacter sp.]
MIKTRVILIVLCAGIIWLLFQLPKSVVENEASVAQTTGDSVSAHIETHVQAPKEVSARIRELRGVWMENTSNEKNAIFADSLASLYRTSSRFDSAGWFSEEAAKFFNTADSWIKAGDDYYQAYTLAIDESKQDAFAVKARSFYQKVMDEDPNNLEIKTKMAMTYLSSSNPMQGITMLREVLRKDPQNELALFNMGMLSIQSRQFDKAVERLTQLVKINPTHIQGQLLLGIAYLNMGDNDHAREQFNLVKEMDKDPAVQATVDSYLNELK